jgi:multiple sugar transport system permease protein
VWIGLGNYRDLVDDDVFWLTLRNTAKYGVLSLPLGIMMSLGLAALLHLNAVGRATFRAIFFLPSLVPVVANAMVWMWMFNGEYGLINHGLRLVGTQGPNWLSEPGWAMSALVIMSLWGVGTSVVIFLAAFQEVPVEMYEAAELDGASMWDKFARVTLPLISPVLYFQFITGLIGVLQIFATSYIMTRGGPARATLFYTQNLYDTAFRYLKMGYACSMAWILFIIILVLTWAATRISARFVHYQGQ